MSSFGPLPGQGPELPSPFAERARRGLVGAFFETFKLVAMQPAEFFRRVRIDQASTAVLFGVVGWSAGSIAASFYAYLSRQQAIAALERAAQRMPDEQAARFLRFYMQSFSGNGTIAKAVLAPLFAVIGIYVVAAVVHLLLTLFRGAHRGFDATLTAVGYSAGVGILLAVPYCGEIVAVVWILVALVIGLGAVQRCGSGKSAAAVFGPAVAMCVLCCCAIFLGVGAPAFFKALQEASEGVRETNL